MLVLIGSHERDAEMKGFARVVGGMRVMVQLFPGS